MYLFACKCLNVCVDVKSSLEIVNLESLQLTADEQRDAFFHEANMKLSSCPGSRAKVTISQPAMMIQRDVGTWKTHSCLICGVTTHSTHTNNDLILVNANLMTTQEELEGLKKSSRYSDVFKVLVPEAGDDEEMKENSPSKPPVVRGSERKLPAPLSQVTGSLNKQLNKTLQAQLEAVEESIRQFRDSKYAEYELFKEKAHRDHKILAIIMSAKRLGGEEWRDAYVDKGPLSPQLPVQRRRLSSLKDTSRLRHFANRGGAGVGVGAGSGARGTAPQDEDSLEAEDIFALDGDSNLSRPDYTSDIDDYDSDQSDSKDEGIHIARRSGGGAGPGFDSCVARSLPVDVPRFGTHALDMPHPLLDEEEPEDIAASIKALARSVQGDVLGELPRPRFSTQI